MEYYDTYDWRKESCVGEEKPLSIETDSSYYVWERKEYEEIKIHVEPREGEEFEPYDITTGWEYLERKITLSQYLAEQQAKNKENIEALMLGMVDLYEMNLGA